MATYDLEYRTNSMFTQFMPNTAAGISAFNTIAKIEGSGKVFTMHLDSTLRQLRAAGYSVSKARQVDDTMTEDDLLDALMA